MERKGAYEAEPAIAGPETRPAYFSTKARSMT